MVYLPLLGPVIGLNLWSFCMEGWMYYERISYIHNNNVPVDNTLTKAQFELKVPPSVRWKADNYNHLFEQPTQFYAVVITQALLLGAKGGHGATWDMRLAWIYVGMRVFHSFVQSTTNPIMFRFKLFVLNSLVLAGLTVRTGMTFMELVNQ
jgi:hypothetical protein